MEFKTIWLVSINHSGAFLNQFVNQKTIMSILEHWNIRILAISSVLHEWMTQTQIIGLLTVHWVGIQPFYWTYIVFSLCLEFSSPGGFIAEFHFIFDNFSIYSLWNKQDLVHAISDMSSLLTPFYSSLREIYTIALICIFFLCLPVIECMPPRAGNSWSLLYRWHI